MTNAETNANGPIYLATFDPGDPNLAAELSAHHPHAVTRTEADGRISVFVDTAEDDETIEVTMYGGYSYAIGDPETFPTYRAACEAWADREA